MISPNVKLSYRRIQSSEKLVFSVSCSLSAGLVPVTNKNSFIVSKIVNCHSPRPDALIKSHTSHQLCT
ncbi:BgTH12-06106 [Blumeria graminis f. sp. triticale]|uniref:BgTH12-06106 n=1 Tax=Blumeria graminis f. sp. triticale TaxID=1689686 RepID=A0A9W4DAN0_BLUGR|nr:BgTH12-06106 [Blumeria graminis f. sp. triticale]